VDNPGKTTKVFASEIDRNIYIEQLVNGFSDDHVITQAQRDLLLQYSGSGQTFGKREGVSAEAGLYEFYTPDYIRSYMWELARHHGFSGGTVLEPSCSTAHMLLGAPDESKCTGFEINPVTYKIAKLCFPKATFYNKYFETAFMDPFRGQYRRLIRGNKVTWLDDYPFDLVIGNPPYGKWQTEYPYFTKPLNGNFWQIEIFFLYKCLELLRPGGILVFLTASSWLRNGNSYQPLKKEVAKIATLVDAYRTGEIFKRTGVPTDILIYKRNG
jgi:type I restriction-modification system DNA methylase subunit